MLPATHREHKPHTAGVAMCVESTTNAPRGERDAPVSSELIVGFRRGGAATARKNARQIESGRALLPRCPTLRRFVQECVGYSTSHAPTHNKMTCHGRSGAVIRGVKKNDEGSVMRAKPRWHHALQSFLRADRKTRVVHSVFENRAFSLFLGPSLSLSAG